MLEYLLEPFSYEYMQKAMWISTAVGGICAFLSAYLMLKGWSLIGDALSHSVVPGVAIAYATSINVQNIILGNILGIADEDIYQVTIIMLICLVLLLIFWKDLLLIFFDETQAITVGLSPLFYKVLFFTLLSACVVAALQTVGAILVIAMVITPGATAYLLTDKFKTLIKIAVTLGAITGFVGVYLSYYLDGATGGVIVTLQTLLFLLAFLFSPKYGLMSQKRRKAVAHE